ncbi:MAG: polyprenyl synthetase family protein [Armatimonadetes bacterium]|nr:polyprenyl synthetase family protein [Armatimonadota bacterium]
MKDAPARPGRKVNTLVDIEVYLKECTALVDVELDRRLPDAAAPPAVIHEAMRYSLFSGGKRLRPALVMAGAEAAGGTRAAVLPAACAMECIHVFSLIHDDLPCMDDDDLRRGKPTCHRQFGEAVALLAGDALESFAFEIMAEAALEGRGNACDWLRCTAELARATGSRGMIGGQALDMAAQGQEVSCERLQAIHRWKTGALLTVSLRMGAVLSGAGEESVRALTRYGEGVGLAFQIMDDILDVVGDEAKTGKRVGADVLLDKATYPRLFGVERSRDLAAGAVREATAAIERLDGRADPLRALARFVVEREG